jgi:hypothetical protein
MQVFQVTIVSNTCSCKREFKIVCNSIVICAHFNKIYIWTYTIAICLFWISIFRHNEHWLLVFKTSARRDFLALGSNRKTLLGPREEKICPPWLNLMIRITLARLYSIWHYSPSKLSYGLVSSVLIYRLQWSTFHVLCSLTVIQMQKLEVAIKRQPWKQNVL